MAKRKKPEPTYRRTAKGMAGMALLNALNEWKDAGGSDVDVLLALDDFLIERDKANAQGKESAP